MTFHSTHTTLVLLFTVIVCIESLRRLEAVNDVLKSSGCIEEYPKFDRHNLFEQRFIHKFLETLHGQHLVMIGDSLTRYLYVSLVYALKYDRFNNDTMIPNIVKEKEWSTWYSYYNGTTTILAPELCDCYRHDSGKITVPVNIENRYYFSQKYNFNISYFQYWGWDIHGHWHDHFDYDFYREPRSFPLAPFWTQPNISTFITNVLPNLKIRPSIILFNAGIWIDEGDTTYFQPDHINHIISSALSVVDRVIYKTTTYTKKLRNDYFDSLGKQSTSFVFPYKAREDLMCSIPGVECFNMSWTRCVNDSYYVDDYHFRASVYNHMLVHFENILSRH